MDDVTSPCSDPRSCPCTAALARLQSELDALRAEMAEGVRTRSVTAVDGGGRPRVRIDGERGVVVVLDPDGFARIRLTADGDQGHVELRARGVDESAESTYADVFALDAEDPDDHPYVGLELIDRGDTATGYCLYETHRPDIWWADPPDLTDE